MQKGKALTTHMSLCGGFLRSACKCVGTRLPPKKDLCCAFDHPTGLPSCRSTPSVGRHLAKNSAVSHLSKSNVRQHVSSSTYCCSQLRTVWLMVSKSPRLGEGVPDFLRRHFQLQRNAPKNKQEPKKDARRQREQHNSTKTTQNVFGICGRTIEFVFHKKKLVTSSRKSVTLCTQDAVVNLRTSQKTSP